MQQITPPFSPEQMRQFIAQAHRDGILSKEPLPNQAAVAKISKLALQWMQSMSLLPVQTLSETMFSAICRTSCYRMLSLLLIHDEKIRTKYFKWVLLGNNPIEIFVRFPREADILWKVKFGQKTGSFSREFITIDEGQIKILVNNVWRAYPDGMEPVVHDAFEECGFIPWDSLEIAHIDAKNNTTNPIDTSCPNWWYRLPRFQTVARTAYLKNLGLPLDYPKDSWVFSVMASRKQKGLDLDFSHSFIVAAIPEGERYVLYPFSKFRLSPIEDEWDRLCDITNTQPARIGYPDPAILFPLDQLAATSWFIEPETGASLMEFIGEQIQEGRKGNLVLQFAWENCANWSQMIANRLFGETIPNFFTTFILSAEPSREPMRSLIGRVREGPRALQPFWILFFSKLLGWHRGVWVEENGVKVFKSVATSTFSKRYEINLPASLHVMIENGNVPGTLQMGYRRREILNEAKVLRARL